MRVNCVFFFVILVVAPPPQSTADTVHATATSSAAATAPADAAPPVATAGDAEKVIKENVNVVIPPAVPSREKSMKEKGMCFLKYCLYSDI